MDIIPIQNHGFDEDGNPIDFIDEEGIKWFYQGQKDGIPYWAGIKED